MQPNSVIQFGLGRTGTTLVYRVLKNLFQYVEKCHLPVGRNYAGVKPFLGKSIPIFCTIRNPIDSFLSYVRVSEYPSTKEGIIITDDLIKKHLDLRIQQENQLRFILKTYSSQIIILKYESFYNDFNYIFQKIESLIDSKISDSKKKEIISECSIMNTIKIQEKFNSFYDYDQESHIHGLHVRTPSPKSSIKFINDEQFSFLSEKFREAIKFWQITIDKI